MEKIKVGLLDATVELAELLAICESLGLDEQSQKIQSMMDSINDALEFINGKSISYLRVNDGTFIIVNEYGQAVAKNVRYLDKADVIKLYGRGFTIKMTTDSEPISLTLKQVLDSFE